MAGRLFTGGLLAAAIALMPLQSAYAQDKQSIKIGLLLSLSGPAAAFGIPARDAVQVLVEDLNARGGVNGRNIALAIYDDTTNPTEAARGATKLIREDGVVAIIGASTGSGTLAAAPVAAREKTPILAPNATISVTARDAKYPYVFRTMGNDLVNTKRLFDEAVAGGAKRVAIFHQEDAYGKDSVEFVKKLAAEANIPIVGIASAPLKAIEVAGQAARLRADNADVVIMQVTAPALGAAFVRAARQVGLDVPIWGSMGLGQKAFIEGAGATGDGVRLVVLGNWDDPPARQAALGEMLKKAGKSGQGFGELIATNGLIAVVEAAKAITGDITGIALRDKLEQLCDIQTYSDGKLCYAPDNHDGWGGDTLMVVEIKDGAFRTISK